VQQRMRICLIDGNVNIRMHSVPVAA
jgi:hypothetical protein